VEGRCEWEEEVSGEGRCEWGEEVSVEGRLSGGRRGVWRGDVSRERRSECGGERRCVGRGGEPCDKGRGCDWAKGVSRERRE